MKALVTGSAGFIGSHLSEYLLSEGWQVNGLDDFSTGRRSQVDVVMQGMHADRYQFTVGSVTDEDLVRHLATECDVVFHLAAAVGVLTIQQKPLESMRVNLDGTKAVIEAARLARATFVFTSTSEVYGKNETVGLTEEADRVLGPTVHHRWSYAEAKAIDEMLTLLYGKAFDLPVVIARLFNTTGPRQTGRYGMVVPRLVRQAIAGEPLTVYGNGEQTRCFGHVADVVPCLLRLATTPQAFGSIFNIGNPFQISINDLAERIITRLGSPSTIQHIDYAAAYGDGFEDMRRRVPDCTKLFELTGLSATRTLDEIIDDVAASVRQGTLLGVG